MDWKKVIFVVGVATIAMVVWTTFKVYFIHDPDNFYFADAKAYAVAFMIKRCKELKCDKARSSEWLEAFEVDEGWVFVFPVRAAKDEPDTIGVLFPRADPNKYELVEFAPQE